MESFGRAAASNPLVPRLVLLIAVIASVAAFFLLDLGRFLTLEAVRAQQQEVANLYAARPWQTAAAFVGIYVAVTGLSLPGATVMTIAAGAAFGLLPGVVLVSIASVAGATLSFIGSRWLFREAVRRRFGRTLASINAGVDKEGAIYLFALRLVPYVPFFAVNVAMALTSIRLWTFVWVSQVGMLLGTFAYVNAGTQLAQITSPADILSPSVLLSFTVLGVLPLAGRRLVDVVRRRRVYGRWRRPRRFDRNLVVIGAGSAGLVAAYVAVTVQARVTLVEKHRMGGDCLNTGCVPSKALLRAAGLLARMRHSAALGIRSARTEVDFAEVMERVQRVVRTVEPHDSVARYTSLGVECLRGEATIVSPWEVHVRSGGEVQRLTTRAIIVAAGARPVVPSIPGLKDVPYVTTDTIWDLRTQPRRLAVLGGGPVGAELAQAFARLGSEVTVVERLPRLLATEDPEVSAAVAARFEAEGIAVRTGHTVTHCEREESESVLVAEYDGAEVRVPFDLLLVAVGRVPNTAGYGLETLGIDTTPRRTIDTNEYLETLYPNIYACGDVAGPFQFTHTASHQAWHAAVNALFGGVRRVRVDYAVIPRATFTDPEVARVGLNESEARAQDVPYEVTTYRLDELDRAIADGTTEGFVTVLTVPGRDRILGVTIVGPHAGELIAEFVLAMRHGLGLKKILGTIHAYPTLAEANRHAAGAWRRAHVSPHALRWLERYHRWMRR